jgi:hypothetical protein
MLKILLIAKIILQDIHHSNQQRKEINFRDLLKVKMHHQHFQRTLSKEEQKDN